MNPLFYLINIVASQTSNRLKSNNTFDNSLDLDQHALKLRRKLGSNYTRKKTTERIILVEGNQVPSNQLALTIALPVFSKYFDANLAAYRVGAKSKLQQARQRFRHQLSMLYAVGAREIVIISKGTEFANRNFFHKFGIHTKEDLENFTLNGVYLGDLIYDEYLSSTHSSTVNFEDVKFQQIFSDAVDYVGSWERIFEKREVSAICIWHDVYFYALPARVAFKFKIPTFSITTRGIYRLTPEWPHAGINPAHQELPTINTEDGLGTKEEFTTTSELSRLDQISESNGAMNYSPDEVKRNDKIRILIANHIFFDAPHCYGRMFYSDFEVWLTKLSEIARETDYVWFLKPHPHAPFWRENNLIEKFAESNPVFRILPIDISKEELNKLGIDFVLTVHGTTSLHYAADHHKVINASRNNPYNQYRFSYTPDSKEHYEKILRNLENFEYNFKFNEVEKYKENIAKLELESWLFINHNEYFEHFKSANDAMSTKSYSYYLESENARSLVEVEEALIKFLNTEDSSLNSTHFNN